MSIKIPFLVVLLANCAASFSAAQTTLPAAEPAELRPGDMVQITVWRRSELSGDFPVAADSGISHPLLRSVQVAGIPIEAAEARLRAHLQRLEADPQFVFQPRFRVTIGGEVRQPGVYTLAPEITVGEAVAMAGGPNERGRMDRVRLRRQGREAVVDLTDPKNSFEHTRIRSGDQIFLDRRTSVFRDYVVPMSSVTAALASLFTLLLR